MKWPAEPKPDRKSNARLRATRFDAAVFARRSAASEGWWSRRVTLPHELACRASAFLVCHDPMQKSEFRIPKPETNPRSEYPNLAGCLRAARSELSFGDSAAC